MVSAANIGFSVLCLIGGIILYLSKLWPKVQIILMLLAGSGMTAGVVGGGIYDGVQATMNWLAGSTEWAFGAPVPGLLALITVFLIVVGWMGKVTWMRGWQRHVIPLIALVSPVTWYLTGGIFGPLALVIGAVGGILGNLVFLSMGL